MSGGRNTGFLSFLNNQGSGQAPSFSPLPPPQPAGRPPGPPRAPGPSRAPRAQKERSPRAPRSPQDPYIPNTQKTSNAKTRNAGMGQFTLLSPTVPLFLLSHTFLTLSLLSSPSSSNRPSPGKRLYERLNCVTCNMFIPGSKPALTSHVRNHHKEEDCSVVHVTNQGMFHYSKEEWLAPAAGLETGEEEEEAAPLPKRRKTVR